jgi:hypothetical protein
MQQLFKHTIMGFVVTSLPDLLAFSVSQPVGHWVQIAFQVQIADEVRIAFQVQIAVQIAVQIVVQVRIA